MKSFSIIAFGAFASAQTPPAPTPPPTAPPTPPPVTPAPTPAPLTINFCG